MNAISIKRLFGGQAEAQRVVARALPDFPEFVRADEAYRRSKTARRDSEARFAANAAALEAALAEAASDVDVSIMENAARDLAIGVHEARRASAEARKIYLGVRASCVAEILADLRPQHRQAVRRIAGSLYRLVEANRASAAVYTEALASGLQPAELRELAESMLFAPAATAGELGRGATSADTWVNTARALGFIDPAEKLADLSDGDA